MKLLNLLDGHNKNCYLGYTYVIIYYAHNSLYIKITKSLANRIANQLFVDLGL